MKKVMIIIAIIAMASLASAASFTPDGTELEPTHGYTLQNNRLGLVNDGSFENGCDADWACATDTEGAGPWIEDLVALGLTNYDGNMSAWLGGYYSQLATCWTTICQPLVLDGETLTFYWQAYVNFGEQAQFPETYSVTIDGVSVMDFQLTLADHLLGYQLMSVDISAVADGELHDVCFEVHNEAGCEVNEVDNLFVDYVEIAPPVATEALSLSRVKAMYR